MTREQLERHQVWCYLGAVTLGLVVGTIWTGADHWLEPLIWPALGLLLFATFTQVPLAAIPAALRDGRFLSAALIGNFVVLPAVVWALIQLAPRDDAVRLGLLLVLLVPCTDWFITFTGLGRGDATRATALAPLLLIVQLLLLPAYLWLMADTDIATVFTPSQVWPAFVVVLVSLGLAAVSERWFARSPRAERVREHLGWGPVPLLSVVVFLVAAIHVSPASDSLELLPVVAGITVAFLASGLILAKALTRIASLSAFQGRTLAFTFGTRNSFIVLPFALALPAGWEVAAIVVVMQSIAELFAMIFYLWFVPRVLFRADSAPA